MKIAYNPKTEAALTVAPSNNDITFDLPGLSIYVKGVKFDGKAYSIFKKYTSATAGGYNGLVPAPSYNDGSTNRFLKEDGTWGVPEGTGFTIVSSTTDGLAPKIGTVAASTVTTQADEWVLTSTKGATPTWRKLPTNAFLNYYRPILINGTSLLGNNNTALNIVAGNDITLVAEKDTNDKYTGKLVINSSVTNITGNAATATNATRANYLKQHGLDAKAVGGLPYYDFETLNSEFGTSGADSSTFYLNLVKKLIKTHSTESGIPLFGTVRPNSLHITLFRAYTLSNYNSTGLPLYCTGLSIDLGRAYLWGTANGVWSYKALAFTSEVNALKDYYWANIKISSASSTSTSPTFAIATATTSVSTPLLSSTGRLTLNATNTGVDLTFNNDDTKSVILNGTHFKPHDAANGKLNLGSTKARWLGIYGNTLDLSLGFIARANSIIATDKSNTSYLTMYNSLYGGSNLIAGYVDGEALRIDYINTSGTYTKGLAKLYSDGKVLIHGTITTDGFIKSNSSDSYVLLGGGGHKALSTLQSEYDSRYVNVTGDTMTGRLSMKTTIKDHSLPTDHCLVINSDAVPSGTTLTLKNAPGIGFHISSYDWGSLVFNGKFNFIDNTSNGYMDVNLKALSASSTISGNYFTSRVATGTLPYACTSTTLNTNLNADLLDGQHGSRYTKALGGPNYVTITVGGDAATYYPVIISSVSDKFPMLFVNISRTYSETAPDSWNTATHKGGLTLTLFWNGSRYWDGNGSGNPCYVVYVYESYCTMVGGFGNSTAGKVVWLRGGGATYHIHAMNGTSVSATVYTSTYTDSARLSFAPKTTVSSYTVGWPNDKNTDTKNTAGSTNTTSKIFLIGATSQAANPQTYSNSSVFTQSGSVYATHFYENSDKQLKINIQELLNSDKMPIIKEFDWKEDNSHSYGLIALELEEQGYSELVRVKDDGYRTVNYSAALSLIVGKLQVKIRELEKEIENLKNKN